MEDERTHSVRSVSRFVLGSALLKTAEEDVLRAFGFRITVANVIKN